MLPPVSAHTTRCGNSASGWRHRPVQVKVKEKLSRCTFCTSVLKARHEADSRQPKCYLDVICESHNSFPLLLTPYAWVCQACWVSSRSEILRKIPTRGGLTCTLHFCFIWFQDSYNFSLNSSFLVSQLNASSCCGHHHSCMSNLIYWHLTRARSQRMEISVSV